MGEERHLMAILTKDDVEADPQRAKCSWLEVKGSDQRELEESCRDSPGVVGQRE